MALIGVASPASIRLCSVDVSEVYSKGIPAVPGVAAVSSPFHVSMTRLVGAIAASRLLKSFVFGVSTLDPLVLVAAAVLVLMLAMAASLVPARRAATINPTQALRAE